MNKTETQIKAERTLTNKGIRGQIRADVLRAYQNHPDGLTRQELADQYGILIQSVCSSTKALLASGDIKVIGTRVNKNTEMDNEVLVASSLGDATKIGFEVKQPKNNQVKDLLVRMRLLEESLTNALSQSDELTLAIETCFHNRITALELSNTQRSMKEQELAAFVSELFCE